MNEAHLERLREMYSAVNRGEVEPLLAMLDDEFEARTRDGLEPGPGSVTSFFESQWENFEITFTPARAWELPDDGVLVQLDVQRKGRRPELGELRTPRIGQLFRFRGDKIVYFEGYQNVDKALRDLGLDEDAGEPL